MFRTVSARLASAVALAALVLAASAASATATTLSAPWTPYTNCPVNEPAMLEGPAGNYGCVQSSSPSGTFKIGQTVVTTGNTELQFGLVGSGPSATVVPATGGRTLVAAPAEVPGGLIGLMCPSNVLLVSQLCELATKNGLNGITAKVELAGTPSHFDFGAGLRTGEPVITLPVKLHLENPLLGSSCYIGSDSEPIVLRPETTKVGGKHTTIKEYSGFNILFSTVNGSTLGDSTFAVPGANGCGGLLAAVVDAAIDLKQGLPSASGNNDLVMNEATANATLVIYGKPTGQQFAAAWNAAVVEP
jgi:hypothetical protein